MVETGKSNPRLQRMREGGGPDRRQTKGGATGQIAQLMSGGGGRKTKIIIRNTPDELNDKRRRWQAPRIKYARGTAPPVM